MLVPNHNNNNNQQGKQAACIISPKEDTIISKNRFKDDSDVQLSKIDIIKKFDNKYKDEEEKQLKKTEQSILQHDNIEEQKNNPEELDEKEAIGYIKNGHGTNGTTPPKPLPRTSRNNSVSEQGTGVADDGTPRPVARPRTSATYKVDDEKKFNRSQLFLFGNLFFWF